MTISASTSGDGRQIASFVVSNDRVILTIDDTTLLPNSAVNLQFLAESLKFQPKWNHSLAWMGSGLTMYAASYFVQRLDGNVAVAMTFTGFGLIVLGFVLSVFGDRMRGLKGRRAHDGGFIRRNRDHIIIGLISLVVGWLINEFTR